jgi:hypothetical protein
MWKAPMSPFIGQGLGQLGWPIGRNVLVPARRASATRTRAGGAFRTRAKETQPMHALAHGLAQLPEKLGRSGVAASRAW